ncbi:MAG: hypothetical protein PWQ99_132 [Clostridia bacterium]|nr:hypothetical protein [Clostridia bacterium]MDN5365473.1 hypothetical protein [Thermacetogenium sp.]MDN5375013.1 hypothetical protein [Thermacetogenium sp.]
MNGLRLPPCADCFNVNTFGNKKLGQVWVELSTRFFFNYLYGFLVRPGPAVGAVGDHGVKTVGKGNNAGAQRDFLAGQAVGVALPVVALVVVPDQGHYFF